MSDDDVFGRRSREDLIAEVRRRAARRRLRRRGVLTAAAAVVAAVSISVPLSLAGGGRRTTIKVIAPSALSSVPPTSIPPGKPTGVPLNASILDLSWADAATGWALSQQPCPQGLCASLERTTDGGGHWAVLPNPPAVVGATGQDCTKLTCVSGVLFATSNVGYLYGPALLLTTDGGRAWTVQTGLQVEMMAVAGGQVFRLVYQHGGCPGPCNPVLQSAPAGSSSWQTVPLAIDGVGWGSSQMLTSGPVIYLALYGNLAHRLEAAMIYRSLDSGRTWVTLDDPCFAHSHLYVLTQLSVAPGGFVAGLCQQASSPPKASVVVSTDGGNRWNTPGPIPGISYPGLIATASPNRIAVASAPTLGIGPSTAQLVVSQDRGTHWTTVASEKQQISGTEPAWLGFQSAETGRWVSGPNTIWTTINGGLLWTESTVPVP